MLIYDCEIKKAIAKKDEPLVEGIEYCDGWRDFENMGISCIAAYNYDNLSTRLFMDDNIDEFEDLLEQHKVIVGFNSISFDNQLLVANGFPDVTNKSYDILVEIWKAAGLGPEFKYPSHIGFGLDACCRANFRLGKTGHGASAPIDYQQGRFGTLIDYCLNDVALTRQLLDIIIVHGRILDPRDTLNELFVQSPLPGAQQ